MDSGGNRFHRAVSLTLLTLASIFVVVELFRTGGFYPRIVLVVSLTLLVAFIRRLAEALVPTNTRKTK